MMRFILSVLDAAESIAPHMDVAANASPSFNYFCKKLRELMGANA